MEHIPVLLDECIEGLNINPRGIYLDGTLGLGGHSGEIARRLDGGRLIAIDRDRRAIEFASGRLREFGDTITYVHGNFSDAADILDELGIPLIDGCLFDLGVSSPQIDEEADRGFSYMHRSNLDMRMDETQELTAKTVVNTWSEGELKRILYEYGEERYAPLIARAIVRRRADKPIETTTELADIIRSAMPGKALREKQNPAKRSFQGIRIAVNSELSAIDHMLETMPERLKPGGRLCIISFQSLEDRRAKDAILKRVNGCTCPKDFPVCVCGFKQTLKQISKKAITPGEEELARNPRARSAKLRIAERL